MSFIITEHERHSKGIHTRLLNTTTGLILDNVFPSDLKEVTELLAEQLKPRPFITRIIKGKNNQEGNPGDETKELILEDILSTVKNRMENQGKHMNHVEHYSVSIGKAMGISGEDLEELAIAGKLHDIGKAFVRPEVLNKPGKLTAEEMVEIKQHPEIGFWLLQGDKRYRRVAEIVRHHHERWDGLGYPGGLKGEEIPLFSRIIAVADAYDAMTTERVYQKTKTRRAAIREVEKNAGSQFDPIIAEVFIEKVLFRLHTTPSSTK